MNQSTSKKRLSDRENREMIQRAIEGLQNVQYPEEMRYYLNILQSLELKSEDQKKVEQILKKKAR